MKQRSLTFTGQAAQKGLWAVIVLGCGPILTAFPTIALFSNPQSPGILLEEIVLDSCHSFRSIEVQDLEHMQTADWASAQHRSLFEGDLSVVAPGFSLGVSSFGPQQNLDYITRFATPPAWTPVQLRLASGMPWAQTTPFREDSGLWLLRRN